MIEKISVCICNESGDKIETEMTALEIQSKLDVVIADVFSEIIRTKQDIADEEIKAAQKFYFAQHLVNYLKEMKENANTNGDR